jgi:hypothetical protein
MENGTPFWPPRGATAILALLANRLSGRSNNTGRSASESHDLHNYVAHPSGTSRTHELADA